MISYTDVMTILLILFVAIAAQAVQELQPEPKTLVQAAQPAPTVRPELPKITEPLPQESTLQEAQQVLRAGGLDPHLEARGLVINLPQTILFASGDDTVSAGALPVISKIAEVLKSLPNKVSLIGHADALPIHNAHFSNNWELSASRSLKLLELLTARYGIPESRLSVASLGSTDPKGSNETVDGRAENRRVEIVILAAE